VNEIAVPLLLLVQLLRLLEARGRFEALTLALLLGRAVSVRVAAAHEGERRRLGALRSVHLLAVAGFAPGRRVETTGVSVVGAVHHQVILLVDLLLARRV
jgi:hypothetical protein